MGRSWSMQSYYAYGSINKNTIYDQNLAEQINDCANFN